MTITAQTGIFGFGGQVDKTTEATTYYKHKAADIDLSPVDDQRLGPPEVGGTPFPTIPYKAGTFAAGGALINPRLEDTIGWLLHGMMGAVSTAASTPETGLSTHTFAPAVDPAAVKWMSFRKYIPGSAALGLTVTGAKVVGFTINLPNTGLVSTRLDVLGRSWQFAEAPSWTFSNATYEDYNSLPISCVTGGYFKIPGYSATELPVVGGSVTLANAPLDVRQEMVFGDPYLEDVTIVGRTMTADIILKWNDPDLYQWILTNSASGTAWSPVPYVQDLEIFTTSVQNIPTFANPYSLKIIAQDMMWSSVGGVRLAGNGAVMLRLTGVALDPASGDYAQFLLVNETANYTWPT